MVVMSWKSLHFKIIQLSHALSSYLLKDQVDSDYFHLKLFRELRNIRLPSSVYPVSDETIISGGVVYFLLSNYDILRFNVYSEEYLVISASFITNDINSYTSRLIKYDGKLRYFFVSGDRSWTIWVFI
uniref:F-box associated beta-propeller type 3 domain-containing protein n=1 Tax=Lactuca sativa TaxID=4236 RepID=A0A9R1X7B9_LACSA|nr:hypothetical protein LSAT_V11C600301290 [Lactuca sativa]